MDQISVVIIDSDNSSRLSLKACLNSFDYIKVLGEFDNLITGYNYIIQEKPAIVFIDICDDTNQALQAIEKISISHRSIMIFVTSEDGGADLIIKTMRAGAREFLLKPFQSKDLKLPLEKAKNIINSEKNVGSFGKIFTVFSNKGGIGKSTIAANLAVSLADITGKRVALVDLNLQLGDITTFLDINPSYDIAYVVTHLNRIDDTFLFKTLEKYKDKDLYILADPPYLEQAEEITSEQISTVLHALKSVFSYIIIDTSSSFDSKTLCSLDLCDNILLVSIVNLPSIRNAQRCLDLFNRLDYEKDKVKLIVNRHMPNEEITVEDVVDALDHPVYWKIPNNYFTVMSAINRGLPISSVDPDANVSESFLDLAALLSNTLRANDDRNPKNDNSLSLFSQLFKKTSSNILMQLREKK